MGKRAFDAASAYLCRVEFAQEKRMQRVAQDMLTRSPGVVLWTTTAVLLKDRGSLTPIWMQGKPQSSQVAQSDSSLRQCLFDMFPAKNGM
jgi:hypothetical protein